MLKFFYKKPKDQNSNSIFFNHFKPKAGVNILQNHGKLFPDGVFSKTNFYPELCVIAKLS